MAIFAYGSMVYPAIEAAKNLAKDGIEATVINARFVKPLDEKLLLELVENHSLILTVEEAYLAGGFGSAVMEFLEAKEVLNDVKIVRLGVPDRIITHGDPNLLKAKYGLDADGIYNKIKEHSEYIEMRRTANKRLKLVK